MQCIVCDKRKAKRFCPAKNASICSQCCGEKRVLEIPCPESCEFLQLGRKHEETEYAWHVHKSSAKWPERNNRVVETYREVAAHLEYVLSRERLSSRHLTDQDAAQALDLLLDSYRTEEKGILYEKTSDDLRVDSLRRALRSTIETYRNPKGKGQEGIVDPKEVRLPLQGAIDCLEFIRDLVASHIEERRSPVSYLNLLARLIPREAGSGTSGSSIIIA